MKKRWPQGQLTDKLPCPQCHTILDGFTSIGDTERPDDGSITICMYCNTICQFQRKDGRLSLRKMSVMALETMKEENFPLWTTLMKAQAAIRFVMDNKRKTEN